MPTHGSLTKAGKVRSQTPKIEGKTRVSPIPRVRCKESYAKKLLAAAQNENGKYRRRYRK
tara:strand:+ start:831 stop:1010 length:180 start_codon:yes stop_codon:yes gene_type:complete